MPLPLVTNMDVAHSIATAICDGNLKKVYEAISVVIVEVNDRSPDRLDNAETMLTGVMALLGNELGLPASEMENRLEAMTHVMERANANEQP